MQYGRSSPIVSMGGSLDSILQWLASSPPAAWVQALGTPIIGMVAVYVAYQSATTARRKLKFDMFEKRLRVYEDVRAFFKLAGTGAIAYDETQTLAGARAHAKFLFADPDIDAFLREVSMKSRYLLYKPPPKQPGAFGDIQPLSAMLDPDHVRSARSQVMKQYRHSKISIGAEPPREDVPGREWLSAAKWIEDNKNRWDTLTLSYLRLNH